MQNSSKFVTVCVWLLMCVPLVWLPGFYLMFSTARLLVWSIALVGLSIVAVTHKTYRASLVQAAQHPVVLAGGAYTLWLTVRSIPGWTSSTWWGSWDRTNGVWMYWAALVMMVFIAGWFRVASQRAVAQMWMWFVGTLLVSTVVSRFFPATSEYAAFSVGRWSGFPGNPLYLACALIFVPWALVQLHESILSEKIRGGVTGAVAFLALFELIQTGARGALLAGAVGAAVYLFSASFSRTVKISIAGVLLVCVVVGVRSNKLRSFDFSANTTVRVRAALWKAAAREIAHKPVVGYGMTGFQRALDHALPAVNLVEYNEPFFDTSHSEVVDITLRGGAIGVLLALAWCVCVWNAFRAYAPQEKAIARATFVAYGVLTATSFSTPWTLVPLLFMIAPALTRKGEEYGYSRAAGWMFGSVAAVVAATAAVCVVTVAPAAYALGHAQDALATNNLPVFFEIIKNQSGYMPFAQDRDTQIVRWGIMLAPKTGDSFAVAQGLRDVMLPLVVRTAAYSGVRVSDLQNDAVFATAYAGWAGNDRGLWLGRAESYEKHALELSPDRAATIFQLADVLREQEKPEAALALLADYRTRHPDLAEAHLYYALMADALGKTQEAAAAARMAFQQHDAEYWGKEKTEWYQDVLKRAEAKP